MPAGAVNGGIQGNERQKPAARQIFDFRHVEHNARGYCLSECSQELKTDNLGLLPFPNLVDLDLENDDATIVQAVDVLKRLVFHGRWLRAEHYEGRGRDSGGHGIRTRNRFPGTTSPVWLLTNSDTLQNCCNLSSQFTICKGHRGR